MMKMTKEDRALGMLYELIENRIFIREYYELHIKIKRCRMIVSGTTIKRNPKEVDVSNFRQPTVHKPPVRWKVLSIYI